MWKKALFTLITVLVSLLLIEIFLGIIFWIKDKYEAVEVASVDVPYIYYTCDSRKKKGVNDHGFSTTYSIRKEDGKYRIALLGGSVARAMGNIRKDRKLFLEVALNDALNTNIIEVVNAAIPAYVVEQEFILTQLILQGYSPDMIIGLDGYNDILSLQLNRYLDEDHIFTLLPHNYPAFKVIERGKQERSLFYKFRCLFKNIIRSVNFLHRKLMDSNESGQLELSEQEIEQVADTYYLIIKDTYDFCRSKGIKYFNFLQPIQFDHRQADDALMEKLYRLMAMKSNKYGYCSSLSRIFDEQQSVFIDECHVNETGNRILIDEIARQLSGIIKAQPSYLELVEGSVIERSL